MANASQNAVIKSSINKIRNSVYGKDVREALATGLEVCYNYVGGQEALSAAIQAREAVNDLQATVDASEETLSRLSQAVDDVGELVTISDTQPTNPENKIWIKPQADQEYKVATFEAYAELWNHVDELTNVYEQGHGGIKSITLDEDYVDPEEEEIDEEKRLKKRYIITFSDDETSYIHITNGQTGPIGPRDSVDGSATVRQYVRDTVKNGTPPLTGWQNTVPTNLSGGDWLWSRTDLYFESGSSTSIYTVSRQASDGLGAVDSVRIGNSEAKVGVVEFALDSAPEANSSNLVSSGGVWSAIEQAKLDVQVSPELSGTPTAPTAAAGTNSTQIATTEFVDNAVKNSQINTAQLFTSPAFTGTPTAPTAAAGTNSTQVATTAFVNTAAESAALAALLDIHAYKLSKTSGSSKKFVIGIPPGTRHILIFSGATDNSSIIYINCSASGGISFLSLGTGSKVVFEKNYTGSNTDCGLRVEVSFENYPVEIYDFVLNHSAKTPTWADARIRASIADAQAYL